MTIKKFTEILDEGKKLNQKQIDRTYRVLDLIKKRGTTKFSKETIADFLEVFDKHEKQSLYYTHISLIRAGYEGWETLTEAVWNEKHSFGMKFDRIY